MIFRNKAPNSGVSRVEAVVSHHPIVVHGKTVTRGGFAIDINFGFLPQLLTFAGKIPNTRAMRKMAKMNAIFRIRMVCASSPNYSAVFGMS
jgi:hypothetical protein